MRRPTRYTRSPWMRTCAAALGLWSTAVGAGLGSHVCPEHGGLMMHGASAPGSHLAGSHVASHLASHGQPHGASHDEPHGAAPCAPTGPAATTASHCAHGGPGGGGGGSAPIDPAHHHGHHCTCPGACCVTGLVTLAAGRLVALPVVPIEVAAASPLPTATVQASSAPDVVLPLPLGPPSLRA